MDELEPLNDGMNSLYVSTISVASEAGRDEVTPDNDIGVSLIEG